MAQRRATQGGQCPSYSVCWARCVRRSEPALTSRSRTWRCGSNSSCFPADRSDLNSGASSSSLLGVALPQVGGVAPGAPCRSPPDRDSLHRPGFRAFWTWKSRRGRVGRPPVSSELAAFVRTLALANPLWCSPPIHGEWLKLGLEVSQRTVARLIPRRPKPPSQSWRTFLHNHLADLVSVDFFVVPTATFRVLYVFGVLLHHRRRVVHFNVTDSPTAAWTAQQIVEAFPDDSEEIGAGSRDDLAAGRAVDVRPYPTRWPAPHKGLSDLSHDRHHRSAFMGSAARIEFWPTIAHQPSSKLSNNYTASRLRAWRSTFSLT